MLARFFLVAGLVGGCGVPCSADDLCPETLSVGRLTLNKEDRVTWNGVVVTAFMHGQFRNELKLLKFLAARPNQIFEYDEIAQTVFPQLMSETPRKRRNAISRIKTRLIRAFKFAPRFDALQTVNSRGYMWRDLGQTSALVNEVGHLRITTTEAFWKGTFVPGFGAAEQQKRLGLLLLMDEVNGFVSRSDFAAEVGLDEESALPLFAQIVRDFERVDSTFGALYFSDDQGFLFSEKPKSKINGPPASAKHRYKFRGRTFELADGPRSVLEMLLKNAPNVVSRENLSKAPKARILSKRLLIEYIYVLRGQVGPGCIEVRAGEGFAWVATDVPE